MDPGSVAYIADCDSPPESVAPSGFARVGQCSYCRLQADRYQGQARRIAARWLTVAPLLDSLATLAPDDEGGKERAHARPPSQMFLLRDACLLLGPCR